MKEPKYAIHFGVIPNLEPPNDYVTVDGVRLNASHHKEIATNLYVDGSWTVWGEGPNDLNDHEIHLVMQMHHTFHADLNTHTYEAQDRIRALLRSLIDGVRARITRGRLADYAVITNWDDTSQQTHFITWNFDGSIYIHHTPKES